MKAESIYDIIKSLEPGERKKLDTLLNYDRKESSFNGSLQIPEDNFIKLSLKAHTLFDANNTCMTVAECAEWLGVHSDTVLRRLHDGSIKGTLVGRVWSIPKMQFLDKIINEK